MLQDNYTQKLQDLMQKLGISSFRALSRVSGVSQHQILLLRQGKLEQMRVEALVKLSQGLQIPLSELISAFSGLSVRVEKSFDSEVNILREEYERSQLQLQQQRELLLQAFQQSSLQLLESLLLQFPTAAQKARENPELAAVNILPLVEKPLARLLQEWGIEAIAPVGAEIPYDPQLHQLMDGTAQLGEIVKVRYPGYRQRDRLLYRAKVSLVSKI
ncbi:nucleotide exchange factor GrpE [Fortiea contorta]|uniref:nucleotide exchange factor GrpE n=1 Tax=Fortiea contorta TaxID=1892405 RepID=UPI00034BF760|nr:nucleotide exchange factor GrpE [Fortiea contorta]